MNETANENLLQLLRATAQGNGGAFKSLYGATSPRLLAVAFTLIQDSALAEDVLQDAFVQIWHRAGDYHADRGSVFTWLTSIVRYRAIDLLRKRRRYRSSGEEPPMDLGPSGLDFLQKLGSDDADDSPGSPLASAISSEANANLHECVDRLSANQQKSVALAFFRGFTHQELADCLAEPLGTIKSRLRRSLSRLKDCLENMSDDSEVQQPTS